VLISLILLTFSRNQVRQISAPAPKFIRRGQISRAQPIIRNPGTGPSFTQQLVDTYSSPSDRGQTPQVDRMQSRNIVQALSRNKNTKGEFANRNFQSDSLSGGGQNPGQTAAAGSEKINIQRKQQGKGWPGVNPINVQAGSGHQTFPGTRLVKKIQKKIKNKKSSKKNPLFANDHRMAGLLADKMMPLVMAN